MYEKVYSPALLFVAKSDESAGFVHLLQSTHFAVTFPHGPWLPSYIHTFPLYLSVHSPSAKINCIISAFYPDSALHMEAACTICKMSKFSFVYSVN